MAYGLTQSMRLTMASSEYATIADNASLSITGDLTIEAWIKIKSTPANNTNMSLFIKSTVGASNRSYEFWYTNESGVLKLRFYFFSAGTPTNYYGNVITYTLPVDTWVHVALICDVSAAAASKVEWVIDGVSQGNGTGTDAGSGATSIYNGTAAFRIGQADPVIAGWYPDAQFSLVRVWSTLRSVSDIAANKCNVLGSTTNLQAEWTLDNTYNDNSGNSNTLTGVNTPTFVTDVPATCVVSTFTPTPMMHHMAISGGLM